MLRSYIRHQLRAGDAHSIHSPFVYTLYTEVIHPDLKNQEAFAPIEKVRKSLKTRKDQISILDLGAGSKTNSSKLRKVGEIARNAEKSARFGRLFFRLAQYFEPNEVVELGTSLGITTSYFAASRPNARIVTMEGCPETARIAEENFASLHLKNIEAVVGNIDRTLPETLKTRNKPIDLIFFDANHRYEPTLRYFREALQYSHSESVFIFDDLYWSKEMTAAWEEIKAHPSVTVTIDLFWIGLVFFRKEQAKENFVLRY